MNGENLITNGYDDTSDYQSLEGGQPNGYHDYNHEFYPLVAEHKYRPHIPGKAICRGEFYHDILTARICMLNSDIFDHIDKI